ncbi:MAG: phosphotransferase family protein [Polynucleobacter sp.]|jgi:acyl-CoA dehydrogenase|nr:phosphotransferase family protein [Polynucleobacter sp.]
MALVNHELPINALQTYLQKIGLATEAVQIELLVGGLSNPTYKISIGQQRYVLRKKPPGKLLPSAHAIDREYRVMQALANSTVPVPEMINYCEDETIIGTPFYLMRFLDGRVLTDQSLPGMTRQERRQIYCEMNRVLTEIHALDFVASGLETFGKPGNYFARQIGRWSKQVQQATIPIPSALSKLIEWLPNQIPEGDETTLVHGDFRLDNLIFDSKEPRIIGVLDWELSTLGHPVADFAYQCMAWRIPLSLWRGIGGLNLQELGIPSEKEYVEMYEERTGRKIAGHWNFYLAYNFFRIAAILHGVAQRAVDGNTNATDAKENGEKAGLLAEIGLVCAGIKN